jgi:hypothetical protein
VIIKYKAHQILGFNPKGMRHREDGDGDGDDEGEDKCEVFNNAALSAVVISVIKRGRSL